MQQIRDNLGLADHGLNNSPPVTVYSKTDRAAVVDRAAPSSEMVIEGAEPIWIRRPHNITRPAHVNDVSVILAKKMLPQQRLADKPTKRARFAPCRWWRP